MLKNQIPKEVLLILQRLKKAGYHVYIVGGAIRDSLLGRAITDWDLCTSANTQNIKHLFSDCRQFILHPGTRVILLSGKQYEITSFKGEKPDDLNHDLACRDFTINAMAYNPDIEEIIDPFGGQGDITHKIIKAVKDPVKRIQEDPLRILRGLRISTDLGFSFDPKTMQAIIKYNYLLKTVAQERIREELVKILLTTRPSRGFKLMIRTGTLKIILPELLEGYLKRQNNYHSFTIFKHIMETVDSVRADPLMRLTALFHDIAKPRVRKKVEGQWRFFGHEEASANMAEEIMGRLRFSNKMIRQVKNLIKNHLIGYNSGWGDAAVRRLIRRVGSEQITELIEFRRADLIAHGKNPDNLKLIDELEKRIGHELQSPQNISKLAIDGRTIMKALGLSPGAQVGQIKKNLLEKIIEDPQLNNQQDLLKLALKKDTIE